MSADRHEAVVSVEPAGRPLLTDTVDKLGMAWFFGVGFWQQRSFIFRPGLIAGAVVCFWSVDFRFGIAIRPVSGQAVVAWP
jgi:hypothetical protein